MRSLSSHFSARIGSETNVWEQANSSGRYIANTITIALYLVVFTQKIAIPLGTKAQVAVALPILIAVYVILFIKKYVKFDGIRTSLFFLMMSVALIFHTLVDASDFSPTSLLLVFTTLSFYVFIIPIERKYYELIIYRFIILAIIAGGLVWFEWATQIVGLGKPNLNQIIPYDFQYRDYNYMNRMWFGPIKYKPNGIFFLETSHASQFIAIGLVAELALFRRNNYIFLLLASLIGTFGGTGITLIILTIPFIVPKIDGRMWLFAGISIPIAIILAFQIGLVDNAIRRMSEFDQNKSSTNIRFILPAIAVAEAYDGPVDKFLFGKGAGSMPRSKNVGLDSFAWAPYSKVIVEYGVIVFILWFALIFKGLFVANVPKAISWALFIQYHLLNGALAVPIHTIYCLLLAGAYLVASDRKQTGDLSSSSNRDKQTEEPA